MSGYSVGEMSFSVKRPSRERTATAWLRLQLPNLHTAFNDTDQRPFQFQGDISVAAAFPMILRDKRLTRTETVKVCRRGQNYVELARIRGVMRRSLQNWRKRKDAPKAAANGIP